MFQQLELCTYSSMNKQYVKGVQNFKKWLLDKVIEDSYVVLLFPSWSRENNISLYKFSAYLIKQQLCG